MHTARIPCILVIYKIVNYADEFCKVLAVYLGDYDKGDIKMYRRSDDVVMRKIHDSFFLIDITDNYSGDKCALYEINETGAFIWEHINSQRDVDELAKLLQTEIVDEIDYKILYDDIMEFINVLKRMSFLLEVSKDG